MAFVHRPGWNEDTLIQYLEKHSGNIDSDNEGQIIIYTGLYQHRDGSLHDTPQEDESA